MKILKIVPSNLLFLTSVLLIAALSLGVNNAFGQSNSEFAATPVTTQEFTSPQVMLSLSADHQYFFAAYSDFSDLDPDPVTGGDGPEVTYENNIEYFGYFDPNKCYSYNTASERFVPAAFQTTSFYCDDVGGDWSGNFLNWATMTRMDVVRKIFYGGFRSTDTATETVIERAHLPLDAHSFAKYYNGLDIDRLTPFDNSDIILDNNDGEDGRFEGITICNTSPDNGPALSETSAAAPVMRVVRGNFSLWAANERWQCTWLDQNVVNNDGNGNDPSVSFINASSLDPSRAANGDALRTSAGQEDRIVRIEVCNPNFIDLNLNEEGCREYPDGNFKPTGILHEFGEDGQIEFGLLTGGFQANTEGGVLRKNIRPFTDEVNVDTDGTFAKNALGVRIPGIVTNMDALRMVGYEYQTGTYFDANSPDTCNFQQVDIEPNECFSWGNPISEILLESVNYLSGGTETAAFDVDDEPRLQGIINRGGGIEDVPGLTSEDWIDVLNADNQCADVTQIVINASVSSFDENFASAVNLPDRDGVAPNIDTLTNDVGDIEGISGNSFFVGSTTANDDQFCTAKVVNNLSEVRGICPEAPTVAGSYGAAGIAFYAATTDLRPGLEGEQNIQTLGITLATNLAVVNVPLGPVGTLESINILPAYRLLRGDGGGGALVDFRIVQGHEEVEGEPGIFTGIYYLNWEDSEQGGDFDNDVWGTLSYRLDVAAGTIEITTNAVSETTIRGQLFGFITSGTTQDGFHAYSGVIGADFGTLNPVTGNFEDTTGVLGCNDCRAGSENENLGGQRGPQSHTFVIDADAVSAQTLQPPLYYAAKYGSFDESDSPVENFQPDLVSEFDVEDNFTGQPGADGVPDGYFAATSPDTLIDAVSRALARALTTDNSSGSAPANLGNSDGDGDLVAQALFFESVEGTNAVDSAVSWTGDIRGFFLDSNGFLREDLGGANGEGNAILDVSSVDNIIQFNNTGAELLIDRFVLSNEDEFDEFDSGTLTLNDTVPANDINSIWSAAENLSSLDNNSIVTNRENYNGLISTTGRSRYITTWIDDNFDGVVDTGEVVPFEAGQVDDNFEAFLASTTPLLSAADSRIEAQNIVNFIRGFENYVTPGDAGTDLTTVNGFRSRTTTDGAGNRTVHRLGDVVSSTTVIVGPPSEEFEVTFGDASYADFRTQYANRRTMVYAGANDGLLHAFNAGFRGESVDSPVQFDLTGVNGGTAHPLGAEIWAYAPNNLLPHLQWLKSQEYLHTFYMDGEPAVFDVNIFPQTGDTVHPNGWGTILVAGMGLGGGDFNIGDVNGDGTAEVTRSAYVVFDITDPEQAPVLLGEITHDDLHHSTVRPTIVRNRNLNAASGPPTNEWTLVFASGPDNRVDYTSSTQANVFTVDLTLSGGRIANTEPTVQVVAGSQNAFSAGISTADWNEDFVDDVVYFGTVEQGAALDDQSGDIYRFLPQTGQINPFFEIDRPVSSTPIPLIVDGANFVYAGTGRYLDQSDALTDDQQYFVGILEEESGFTTPFNLSNLNDVTDIVVNQNIDANGDIIDVTVEGAPAAASSIDPAGDDNVTTFEELSEFIITGGGAGNGWLRRLGTDVNATFNPDGSLDDDGTREISERVISDADTFFPVISWATFVPEESVCEPEIGEAFGYVADLVTGTASELAPIEPDPTAADAGPRPAGIGFRIGFGVPSDTNIVGTESGDAVILNGTSEGDVERQFLRLAQPDELRRVNWREILQ